MHHLLLVSAMTDCVLAMITAFILANLAIPSLIYVAEKRKLYDDFFLERKKHRFNISRLGGVAIFCGVMITTLLFVDINAFYPFNYVLISSFILFGVGLKDDLAGVSPGSKIVMQFFSSLIIIVLGDVRLTSMYGIFYVQELPYWLSVILTLTVVLFLTNAFNLIDGIDGLAGTVGSFCSLMLGGMFIWMHSYNNAVLCLAMAGSLIGFLRFNISPARIFMGDAGALVTGFMIAVFTIRFIELNNYMRSQEINPFFNTAVALAIAITIVPLFDALRVFCIRCLRGCSPFKGDRNHIHHRMISIGFSEKKTILVLLTVNIVFTILAICFDNLGNSKLLILFVFMATSLDILLHWKEKNIFKKRSVDNPLKTSWGLPLRGSRKTWKWKHG